MIDLNSTRILITGASGSLGTQLAHELIQKDIRPICGVRESSRTDILDRMGLEKRTGDLRNRQELAALVRDIDLVVHTAALVDFRKDRLTNFTGINVMGAVDLYRAARNAGVKRFVHVSSIAAVGARKRDERSKVVGQAGWILSSNGRIDESWEFNLQDIHVPYIMTKHAAEVELRKEAADGGPELVIVNPSIILAPSFLGDDRHKVLETFSRWFLPGFSNMVNLVDVRDVAGGIVGAMERGRTGERYLLTGDNISARDLVLSVSAILRKAPQVIEAPRWLVNTAARIASGWTTTFGKSRVSFYPDLVKLMDYDWMYTSARARHELGYSPRSLLTILEELLSDEFADSYAKV